jgi:thioester reductase-like protein
VAVVVAVVGQVLHAGALVNHALTYKELFGPNVLGSLHIMDFCLRGTSLLPLTLLTSIILF